LVRSPGRGPRRSASAHQLSLTRSWQKPKLARHPRRLGLALTATSENTPPSVIWTAHRPLPCCGRAGARFLASFLTSIKPAVAWSHLQRLVVSRARLDSMSASGLPAPTDAQLYGEELYGDNFTDEQVERWFADEADAHVRMSGESQAPANYGYRELNRQALFRHIAKSRRFHHALGFGSGFGTELAPLATQIERLTIIESSEGYGRDTALVMPISVVRARPNGDLALSDASVDLATCFNVLHHIPNVSHVLSEFARVLQCGGPPAGERAGYEHGWQLGRIAAWPHAARARHPGRISPRPAQDARIRDRA
jgi:Methyltransferase domain